MKAVSVGFELVPPSRGDAVLYLDRARRLRGLVDFISIPDTPGGEPRACSVAAAALVRERVGAEAVVHVKTANSNRIAIYSQMIGAALAGACGVLLTRGDRPRQGVYVRDVEVEDVFRWARSRRDFAGLRIGVTVPVPLRYPERLVERRLRLGPDFVYTQVVSEPEEVAEVAKYLRSRGAVSAEIFVPMVAPSKLNEEALKPFGFSPARDLEGVAGEAARHGVNILLSSPADFEAGLKALRRIREFVGGGIVEGAGVSCWKPAAAAVSD